MTLGSRRPETGGRRYGQSVQTIEYAESLSLSLDFWGPRNSLRISGIERNLLRIYSLEFGNSLRTLEFHILRWRIFLESDPAKSRFLVRGPAVELRAVEGTSTDWSAQGDTLDPSGSALASFREEQWETCRGGQTTQKAKLYLGDLWTSQPEQVLPFSLM